MDANSANQRSRTYGVLARAFSEAEPGLEREFARLFLGPGRPVAYPYESVYREGRIMGKTTLDVQRRMAGEGLAPSGQTLSDHVSIELAFMAHLSACEALAWDDGEDDKARGYVALQDSFLHDHLIAWLPQFCHRVLAGRPHAYYAELTSRSEAFVTTDAARLRALSSEGTGAPTRVAAERQRWSLIADQGCTLCEICVQVCSPGALQQVREAGTVILRFDATLCDGCGACQRWCPEGSVRVVRVSDGRRPPAGELARSAMEACPRCGQLHAPAALVAKVQAQLGLAAEVLLHRLALCPDCKAMDVPLPRRNAVQQIVPSSTRNAKNLLVHAVGRVPISTKEE